jgi:hypothetical protein
VIEFFAYIIGQIKRLFIITEEVIMKKIVSILLPIVLLGFQANAATVEVKWKDPDKYTDIRAAEQTRGAFRDSVFRGLEKHFQQLAAKLPENYQWRVEVTNIDLAGEVEFGGGREVRVVRSITIPRISFNYQLLDDKKQIVKQDEVALKDMSFMDRTRLKYRHDPLGYEKNMIDRWFEEEPTFQALMK